MEFNIEKFSTTCQDGVELSGLLIVPEKPKAVVQFNCGTGAKKEFYQYFLEFLASHGYISCLWDYRGNGDSAPESLQGCDYTFREYGIQDIPAIKKYLRGRYTELPFFFVTHSAGGQMAGFSEELSDVEGMVAFAVSTGYPPFMPLGYRLLTWYFFYIFTPISNMLTGYVKSKAVSSMENLPRNVALEWRSWCAKKDYFFDSLFYGNTVPEGHYENMPFPIHVFSVTDDTISSAQNIQNFWKHVKSEHPIEFTEMSPQEFKVKKIGHMGFFRRQFRETIWQTALEKLESFYQSSL